MTKESSKLPSGKPSVVDCSMVSLSFALRATVLRLAVSPLWSLACEPSRTVAVGAAHGQNQAMCLKQQECVQLASRAQLRSVQIAPWPASPRVRANPSLKPTCLRHAA